MSLRTTYRGITLVIGIVLVSFTSSASAQSRYTPVTKYDPKRDAAQDIRDAAVEAKRTNRRVLLEVGGDWCSWCHHMDDFFQAHPDLTALRDKSFITVKINFSEENPNKEILAQYPAVAGYPHLFVLDSKGTLVHSQDTSALEEGKSYNLERFTTFLAYWTWAKEK
ncbi:MAG TPA: thioredoxin family protein [Pyrinomonadaceae bacterium]|nr:thioredoxin family protein [Pyrinomonadaceae bacterium]